jgi:hypothetical protein
LNHDSTISQPRMHNNFICGVCRTNMLTTLLLHNSMISNSTFGTAPNFITNLLHMESHMYVSTTTLFLLAMGHPWVSLLVECLNWKKYVYFLIRVCKLRVEQIRTFIPF